MRIATVAVWLIASVAAPAVAQQTVSQVLGLLVTSQSIETGSIERDRAAAEATSATISRALLANLATLPVTTSSGGFVYRLDPGLGTVARASESFGPVYIERALTVGRLASSFGLTLQHMRFSTLDGENLRDGSLVVLANRFRDEATPFDVDRLSLDIDANIATLYGNIGINDRTEVGVAVPFVALRLKGSRVNTYRDRLYTQASASASSLGLADVVVRTKVTALRRGGTALAVVADGRLPTGSEDNLMGAGSASLRLSGIGSFESGAVATHLNAGASVGGLAREVSYGGAVTLAASGRVTILGELFGRSLSSRGRIEQVSAPHPTLLGVETLRLATTSSRQNFVAIAPGFKWNLNRTWVLVANASIPLTDNGLAAPVTPFVGLDYVLQR